MAPPLRRALEGVKDQGPLLGASGQEGLPSHSSVLLRESGSTERQQMGGEWFTPPPSTLSRRQLRASGDGARHPRHLLLTRDQWPASPGLPLLTPPRPAHLLLVIPHAAPIFLHTGFPRRYRRRAAGQRGPGARGGRDAGAGAPGTDAQVVTACNSFRNQRGPGAGGGRDAGAISPGADAQVVTASNGFRPARPRSWRRARCGSECTRR